MHSIASISALRHSMIRPGQVGVGIGHPGGRSARSVDTRWLPTTSRERLEPERRDRGEHPALVQDRLVEHHVEGREAVGGDHQQLVVADGVDVPDLAGVQVGKREAHPAEPSGRAS